LQAPDTEVITEELQKLYEQTKVELKYRKEQNITLSTELDNLSADNNRLKKQIEFLEGSLVQDSLRNEESVKGQQVLKETERAFRAEIASRDNKINNLTAQQEGIKSESQRLHSENLILEQEKAKLKQDIELLKGDDSKAASALTVERLRADLSEKEVSHERLISEHIKTKRDLEKHIDDLMEHINAKIAENDTLKKAKATLEKDYADISAILEDKMSDTPVAANEAAQFQTQIMRLSEQLTYMTIDQSDLQDQLAKVETEKLELNKQLAQLKTKHVRAKKQKEKKQRDKERSTLQREVQKLKGKSVDSLKTPRNPNKSDETLYAAILIQSRLRGIRARRQFRDHKYRYQVAREIMTTERSYVASLRVLTDCFIEPLRRLGYLTEEEIEIVFGNTEQLLKSNSLLSEALEDRLEAWHVNQGVGDIFVQFLDSLKPHVNYIEHFATTQEAKERVLSGKTKAEDFFKIVQIMPQLEGKTLNDLQIMPVQRVPRYKLLLEDLYKNTPKTHPDNAMLSVATNQIAKLARDINENNRRAETLLSMSACTIPGMEKLPPNKDRGLLVKCHVAAIIGGAKATNCMVHIFTDCIVFTKEVKKRLSIKLTEKIAFGLQEKMHHHIMLTNDTKAANHNKLTISGTEYSNVIQISDVFLIFSKTPKMIDFINHINTAIQISGEQH